MDENIMNAGSEVAEEVIEKTIENMDYRNLKYLGCGIGIGAVGGIFVYRKILVPMWAWIMQKKWRPKKNVVKVKPVPKEPEDMDKEDMDDETEE